MVAPSEELAQQLRGAIWYDLRSNVLIGNGNELAARWFNGGSDRAEAPRLHIQNLVCSGSSTRLRCRFGLFREGGVATYFGEVAPDRLACRVTFRRSGEAGSWEIPRLPPGPHGGHSRITIRCRAVA
jgi:hypothetical protein